MKVRIGVSVLSLAVGSLIAGAEENSAVEETAENSLPVAKKVEAKASFTTIPYCSFCEGEAEVQRPGADWTAVEEGKFYPLGSMFRTRASGKLTLALGVNAEAKISGDASFGTLAQGLGVKTRTIVLGTGELNLDLADNMPEGALSVTAPGVLIKNLSGESKFIYAKTSFGDRVVVRCVTGSLSLEGRHFEIPSMGAADEVTITGEHDHLVTILENTSGDYAVRLDQGSRATSVIAEDGSQSEKVVSDKAEIKFFPKMKVNIHRAVPAVGERMSVFILAFDATGTPMGPGVSFCEGRTELTHGELVTVKEKESEEMAKKAAEASETTESAADEEPAKEEDKSSDSTAESSSSESSTAE